MGFPKIGVPFLRVVLKGSYSMLGYIRGFRKTPK